MNGAIYGGSGFTRGHHGNSGEDGMGAAYLTPVKASWDGAICPLCGKSVLAGRLEAHKTNIHGERDIVLRRIERLERTW